MNRSGFYSASNARRSLWHFLAGKLMSAASGIVFLVWVVRTTAPAEYGTYVALLALLEVFYLATGLGLSTMAQRYVAEFRLRAPHAQFRALLSTLVLRRMLFSVAGTLLVFFAWPVLMELVGLATPRDSRWWFAAWLVLGCGTRYLDEVLPALLQQGASQILNTAANLLRLAGLVALTVGGHVPSHLVLVQIEVGVAVFVLLAGLGVLHRLLRASESAADMVANHHNVVMWQVSLRFYVVQLLGQAWSPNMARLLVSRLAGAAQMAVFGFSQALVDMLRNYLPTYLLATWVRPLMVARWVATARLQPVMDMAGAVFKLSLITLAPCVGLLLFHGDNLARWISNGRYGDGVGVLLAALVVQLALQSLHLCLGMVCSTLERAAANVWATAACISALPLAWLLWPHLGLLAVPAALALAEVLWVLWVTVSLRRAGFAVALDAAGLGKVLFAGGLAGLAAATWPGASGLALMLPALLAGLVMLASCAWLKPLTAGERDLLAQIVPRRWLFL